MKRLRPMMTFFLGLTTIALLCSCNSEVGPEGGTDTLTPKTIGPKVVYLYMDNSESMAGYTKATDGVFVDAINAIGGYYKSQGVDIESYYLQSKTVKGIKKTDIEPVEFDALCSQISSHKLPKTDSYAIDCFFTQMTTKMLSDSNSLPIAFFITDGIISGTNEEINNSLGKRFSIDNASTLSSRVADALRPLSEKGYGGAVYRFTSGFSGDYFPYYNQPSIDLTDVKRPLYIIAIGDNSQVMEFDKKVTEGLGKFKPEKSLLIAPKKPLHLLGEKIVNTKGSDLVKINYLPQSKGSEKTKANIKFRKECLHGHLRDASTAAKAIEILFNSKDTIIPQTKGEDIRFELSARKNEKDQPLSIVVKDIVPYWVEECSSDDDGKISSKNTQELSKTFKLKDLVKGIMEGIYNSDGSVTVIDQTFYIDNTENK